MIRSFRSLAAICAMAVLSAASTGCDRSETQNSNDSSTGAISSGISSAEEVNYETEKPTISNDEVLSETATCTISFSDGEITVSGSGATASDDTVTINNEGVFTLSGASENAKVLIEAGKDDKVTLILDGLSLSCKNGAAIDCEEAGELIICTAKDSENSVSDSDNYTFAADETEPDAAIFCRSDLTLSGGGELAVKGNYNDAIKCKDNLQIIGGSYDVTSVSDGITGKDSLKIFDGSITVNAGKDGIKSSQDNDPSLGTVTINGGDITINSEHDGIQAETKLSVFGGNIKIVSGGDAAYEEIAPDNGQGPGGRPFGGDWGMRGGSQNTTSQNTATTETSQSLKGLKAGGDIMICNKDTVVDITSADDAIHSNANINISGGQITLSSCDDAVHADEILTIENGTINVTKSYEGLEGKSISIGGGTIDIIAADDGMNAAGGDNGSYYGFENDSEEYYISISGGDITVNADGDGIDSNGSVAMSGGRVVVYGPTNSGNGALDYGKSFAVSGGELTALGASGMAQAPSTLSQPCISITSNVSAGSKIEVKSDDGTVVMSTTTPKNCQSLIFSSFNFKEGSTYNVYVDDKSISTVTAQNGVTGNGGMGGNPGGFGGNPGGRGENPGGMGGNPGGGRGAMSI